MQALPSAFFHHVSSADAHFGAARLNGEVDNRRRPADGRGPRTGQEVVGGFRAAEGHIEMSVRIDATGQQQQPARIHHLVRRAGRNARANLLDRRAVDQQIGLHR